MWTGVQDLLGFPLNGVRIGPVSALGLSSYSTIKSTEVKRESGGQEVRPYPGCTRQGDAQKQGKAAQNCAGVVQSASLVIRHRAGGVGKTP